MSGRVSPESGHGAHQQTPKHAVLHSGRFLFIALMALEPCCPLSLFQAWLSCMLMDLTFAETKTCRYNDFTGPAGCLLRWWDRTLKKNTHPGPPRYHQTVRERLRYTLLEIHCNVMHNILEVRVSFKIRLSKLNENTINQYYN